MSTRYSVVISPFAQRHFIKDFEKKYKGAWSISWKAIEKEFQNIDVLFERSIAETIVDSETIKICKTEFRVAGTQQSRHASGNRCIVALHKDELQIVVLLVYKKSHLSGSTNETAQWKKLVRANLSEYAKLL